MHWHPNNSCELEYLANHRTIVVGSNQPSRQQYIKAEPSNRTTPGSIHRVGPRKDSERSEPRGQCIQHDGADTL